MKALKENRNYENDFVIIEDDCIETKFLCECYGDYGVVIGCYDAGCYTSEDDNWKDGDEETHIEVDVYEYHDGHNWVSLLVSGNLPGDADIEEIDNDDEAEILEHFENAKWGEWNNGICTGKTEKYEFTKSQWQGSFGIADVKII